MCSEDYQMQHTACLLTCASAALFLVSTSRGFGQVDPWLKYTAEGTHLREQGRYSEAESRYLDAYRLIVGAGEKGERLAASLNTLASVYAEEGRYVDAETFARRALDVYQQISAPKSAKVAMALNNLAEIYRVQAKSAAAEPLYLQALSILEQATPPNDSDLAATLNNLALLRMSQGRLSSAEPLLRRAMPHLGEDTRTGRSRDRKSG